MRKYSLWAESAGCAFIIHFGFWPCCCSEAGNSSVGGEAIT